MTYRHEIVLSAQISLLRDDVLVLERSSLDTCIPDLMLCYPVQQHARVEDVVCHHKHQHRRTIECDEIALSCDDLATPAICQFDSSVDASHDNEQDGEYRYCDEGLHVAISPEESVLLLDDGASEYEREESSKDQDAGELEVDTCDHGVGAAFRVAFGCLIERYSCQTAAYSLHDERNDIDGAEDPEIGGWAERRRLSTCELNDAAEDDIHGCREESRGDDEGADLHQEGVCIVRTFVRPGTGGPADELSY